MKNTITLIIGLPGSGKSTLIGYYKKNPFIKYTTYEDWNDWTHNSIDRNNFNADIRLDELENNIKGGKDILIECTKFCDSKFLHQSELYLTSKFINIKINRIYFENNLESAIANIKYRDNKKGGYWEDNKKGEMWYYGDHYNNVPLYKVEINNATELSKEYIIPLKYKALLIMVQNIKELPK